MFVISAGLAREYDQEYLVREPWYVLLPMAASLVVSGLIFVAVGLATRWRTDGSSVPAAYGSFLALFWMTAPLAWLYAIPYERFLDPATATEANLWTLAVVAAWRVVLITRVISVWAHMHPVAAFFIVMLPADIAALIMNELSPVPLPAVMGGVRASDVDAMIWSAKMTVTTLGVLSLPVWIVGALWVLIARNDTRRLTTRASQRCPAARSLNWVAIASLLIWPFPLLATQQEQRLRWQVESRFRQGDIRGGLDAMSAREPRDFPPMWHPPGRYGYSQQTVDFFDVAAVIADHPTSAWVRAAYVGQFDGMLGDYRFWRSTSDVVRTAEILSQLPEGAAIARTTREHWHVVWDVNDEPPEYRAALDRLMALAGQAADGSAPITAAPSAPSHDP